MFLPQPKLGDNIYISIQILFYIDNEIGSNHHHQKYYVIATNQR